MSELSPSGEGGFGGDQPDAPLRGPVLWPRGGEASLGFPRAREKEEGVG